MYNIIRAELFKIVYIILNHIMIYGYIYSMQILKHIIIALQTIIKSSLYLYINDCPQRSV